MGYQSNKSGAELRYMKYGAIALGAFLLFKKFSPLLSASGLTVGALADKAKQSKYQKETGADEATVTACQKAAKDINDAFHAHWDEDEEKAIDAVNRCKTLFQIQLLDHIYQSEYGYSLKGDFGRYISGYNLYTTSLTPLAKKYLYE